MPAMCSMRGPEMGNGFIFPRPAGISGSAIYIALLPQAVLRCRCRLTGIRANILPHRRPTVRLPRQRITDNSGQNMELNPRPVDIAVTRPIGETLTGRDSQLDAAVKSLLGDIGQPRNR